MNTREYAIDIINGMSEKQLEAFIDFMTEFLDRNTLARIESTAIARNPNPKCYSSFQEALTDLENEDE
jgi:hypothetical protein